MEHQRWRRVAAFRALNLLCLALGLGAGPGCESGRTFLRVTVDSVEPLAIEALRVTVQTGGHTSDEATVTGAAGHSTPVVFALEFDSARSGDAIVRITAQLPGGATRKGEAQGVIRTGAVTDVRVVLAKDAAGASTCFDGIRGGDEADIDCGGATCGPCAAGRACGTGDDCRSGRCEGERCAGFEPVGPWGMGVSALSVDPTNDSLLYAASHDGVYRSADGGRSWRLLPAILDGEAVHGVLVDPTDPARVYLRTEARLLVSADRGAHWKSQPLAVGPYHPHYPPATPLAVAPTTPPTLLVAGDDGLVTSSDGGEGMLGHPIAGRLVLSLAVKPDDPKVIFAGTHEAGVFRSRDGGGSFELAGAGGSPADSTLVLGLALAPGPIVTAYAATMQGLFVFRDGGGAPAWMPEGQPPIPRCASVAIDPVDPARVFVATVDEGVFRRAGSWSQMAGGLEPALPAVLVATGGAGSTVIYTGTAAGVFRGATSGGAWTAASTGLDAWRVRSLAIDPRSPQTAYVVVFARGYGAMTFRTTDGGTSWTRIALDVPEPDAVVVAVRGGASVVHLASHGLDDTAQVAASSDGGGSFGKQVKIMAPDVHHVRALAVDPQNPAVVLAAEGGGNGDSAGIFRSSDGGMSWSAWSDGLPRPNFMMAPLPYCEMPALVFDGQGVAYAGGCGAYARAPGDLRWTHIEGTGADQLGNPRVEALAYGSLGSRIYAGTDDGTYVTPAGMQPAWQALDQVSSQSHVVYAVLPHATEAALLWAGTASGLAWSRMGGTGHGLAGWPRQALGTEVHHLVAHPDAPLTVLAGSSGRGVWKTTTGGF